MTLILAHSGPPVTDHEPTIQELADRLKSRTGVDAGTTWAEFVEAVERLGVRPEDNIASIEWGIAATGSGLLTVDEDELGFKDIREVC